MIREQGGWQAEVQAPAEGPALKRRRDFILLRRKEVNGLHGVKDGKQNRGAIKKCQDGVHAQ